MNLEDRRSILVDYGASDDACTELLGYCENRFLEPLVKPEDLPLADERFADTWQRYQAESESRGVINTLTEKLPQLNFPIEAGISETQAYKDSTRRGKPFP